MAPKSMKRPAGVETEKLGRVSKALKSAACLPDVANALLPRMAEASLVVPKAERHNFHASLVGMIEEALGAIGASHDEEVQRLRSGVDECPGWKEKREADVVERERELAGLKEAIAARRAEAEVEEKALLEAHAVLKQAKKETAKGDKEREQVAAKLQTVKSVQTEHLGFVKENTALAGNKSYKAVLKLFKELGLDGALLAPFSQAAKKPKDGRGEFELECLARIDGMFSKQVEDMSGALAESEAAKAARDEKVSAAQAALDDATKRKTNADGGLASARDAERKGQKALKDAQAAVTRWLFDCKDTMDAYDVAVAGQADFASALSAFSELKELEPPSGAEPPPGADEEPAADAGEAPAAELPAA